MHAYGRGAQLLQEERDIVESCQPGVNSYLVKPVDFEHFIETARVLGLYWILMDRPPARAPGT